MRTQPRVPPASYAYTRATTHIAHSTIAARPWVLMTRTIDWLCTAARRGIRERCSPSRSASSTPGKTYHLSVAR